MESLSSGAPLSMLDCIFEEEETESTDAPDAGGNGQERQAILEDVLRHLTCRKRPRESDENEDGAAASESSRPRERPRPVPRSERTERRLLDCLWENLEAIAEIGTPIEGRRSIFRVLKVCRRKTRKTSAMERREERLRRPNSFQVAIEKLTQIRDMLHHHDGKIFLMSIRTEVTSLELRKEFESDRERIRRRLLNRSELDVKQRRRGLQQKKKRTRARRRPVGLSNLRT